MQFACLNLSPLPLGTCGAGLIPLGTYFAFLRPPLLAANVRYNAISEAPAIVAMPDLAGWLKLAFIVLGRFATSSGVALTPFSF